MADEDGLTYGINPEGTSGEDALSRAIAAGVAGHQLMPDTPEAEPEPEPETSSLLDLPETEAEPESEGFSLEDLMELSEADIDAWVSEQIPEHAQVEVARAMKQARKLGHGDKFLTKKSMDLSDAQRRVQAKEAELDAKLKSAAPEPSATEGPDPIADMQASYTAWYRKVERERGYAPTEEEQAAKGDELRTRAIAKEAARQATDALRQEFAPVTTSLKTQEVKEQWETLFAKLPIVLAETQKDERVGLAIAARAQELGLKGPNALLSAAYDLFGDKLVDAAVSSAGAARTAQGKRVSNQLPTGGARASDLPPKTTDIATIINHAQQELERGRRPKSLPRRPRGA